MFSADIFDWAGALLVFIAVFESVDFKASLISFNGYSDIVVNSAD